MLTTDGPSRYRHDQGDTYRIVIATEGTGERIAAILGDQPLEFPADVDEARYGPFLPRYEINALFTFTVDAEPDARYTVTFIDSDNNVVDTRRVRLPSGANLPRTVQRLYEFQVP